MWVVGGAVLILYGLLLQVWAAWHLSKVEAHDIHIAHKGGAFRGITTDTQDFSPTYLISHPINRT